MFLQREVVGWNAGSEHITNTKTIVHPCRAAPTSGFALDGDDVAVYQAWCIRQRVAAHPPFQQMQVNVRAGSERRKAGAIGSDELERADTVRLWSNLPQSQSQFGLGHGL